MKRRSTIQITVLLACGLLWLQPAAARDVLKDNPFFQARTTPFQAPPFDKIQKEHFLPAFKQGIRKEQAEIDAIAAGKWALGSGLNCKVIMLSSYFKHRQAIGA